MPAKKTEQPLHPVEAALRDELGANYPFVITAQETFGRLISHLRAAGNDLRYEVNPRPLDRFARQRQVEILIYDRRTSKKVPVIRTGLLPEMTAYSEATQEVTGYVGQRRQARQDKRRHVSKGGSYAQRMQLRLI